MIPFARPSPPTLSDDADGLRRIEDSGVFSNFGPVNRRFEEALRDEQFGGTGDCLTVCNATLGLMIAIRQATEGAPPGRRFALMPSFTFAAAAQAAIWCGLTPLFCDIDRATWAADPAAERRLLLRHRGRIAVIVPYATFGFAIDLERYEALWREHGIPVVVDAAASLGTRDAGGRGFGTGFPGSVVFSMHATKPFSTGEGGVIHSGDPARIATLRAMSNFGFGMPRTATMPGLNAKLSEVAARLAERKLAGFCSVMERRSALARRYRERLPGLAFQPEPPGAQAHQFMPILLPRDAAALRPVLLRRMEQRGIGVARYFSPHLAEHPYLRDHSRSGPLPVTDDVAARIVSLPLHDAMSIGDVDLVADALLDELHSFRSDEFDATPLPEAAAPLGLALPPFGGATAGAAPLHS